MRFVFIPFVFIPVAFVIAALAAGACAPSRDGFFTDILVTGPDGLMVTEGEIIDVIDAPSGVGSGYAVTGAPTFSLHYLYDRALDGDAFDFDDLTTHSRLSTGAPLNLAFAFDPMVDRYALADEASLVAATLMHHVSHILRDYRDIYGEHSTATSTPYLVGIHGELRLWDQAPVDVTALGGDTAYHPFGDGVFLGDAGPYTISPLPVSPGLVGHELQHRVMFHNVIVNGAFEAWTQIFRELDVNRNDPTTILPATHIAGKDMLRYRAFDEGMANLFGAAYSGNSNIYADVHQYPQPDQDLAHWLPPLGHTERDLDCVIIEPVGEESVENVLMSGAPYAAGSPMIARFWQAAAGDPQRVREAVLPAVIEALDDIAALSVTRSAEEGRFWFSFAGAMNKVAERLPEPERTQYCAYLGCFTGCTLRTHPENGTPLGTGAF